MKTAGSVHIPAKRPASRIIRYKKIALMTFVVLLGALGVLTVIRLFVQKPSDEELGVYQDTGTFFDGITINGLDVSGMSYLQARSALAPGLEANKRSINITIAHGTTIWLLTAADMGVTSTLDEVLGEAMALGRSGTVVGNIGAQNELEQNGASFEVIFKPDMTLLGNRLNAIADAINTEPVEPEAICDAFAKEPAFTYVEGSDGYVLNEQKLAEDIVSLFAAGIYVETLEPALEYVKPERTIEELQAVTKLRATWQTSFGGSRAAKNEKRVGNIQKATTLLNGAKVEVGEQWSFNGFIGPRTEAAGWPLAPGIVSGERYEDQPGGGICQVSTTLYNALLAAGASLALDVPASEVTAGGLVITERYHHSWPSSYADKGLDATVTGTVESGKSLDFVNNTSAPLYIFAYCDRANYLMTIYLYGEPLPEGVTYVPRGVVDEEVPPGETVIEYNPQWPLNFESDTYNVTARTGYVATVYRDKYINGALQPNATEKLYTEKYRAVTGKRIIGSGDPSLPAPVN